MSMPLATAYSRETQVTLECSSYGQAGNMHENSLFSLHCFLFITFPLFRSVFDRGSG